MTHGGEIYLTIILAAFLSFAATLFWAMVNSSRRVGAEANTEGRRMPKDH